MADVFLSNLKTQLRDAALLSIPLRKKKKMFIIMWTTLIVRYAPTSELSKCQKLCVSQNAQNRVAWVTSLWILLWK